MIVRFLIAGVGIWHLQSTTRFVSWVRRCCKNLLYHQWNDKMKSMEVTKRRSIFCP